MKSVTMYDNIINTDDIDLGQLIGTAVRDHEISYTGNLIYKYFFFERAEQVAVFSARPSLKFATKTQLYDPFEFASRWSEMISARKRAYLINYFEGKISSILGSRDAVKNFSNMKLKNQTIYLIRSNFTLLHHLGFLMF